MASSLGELARLMLADPAVRPYASAVVAALVDVNQEMLRRFEAISSDIAAVRAEVAAAMKERTERRAEENGEGRLQGEKAFPAFSVYLRERTRPSEEGTEPMREEDDEEGHDEEEEEQVPEGTAQAAPTTSNQEGMGTAGMSAHDVMRSLALALSSSAPAPQPLTVGESSWKEEGDKALHEQLLAESQGGKRIVLPCPRTDCEVILYSELGFSAHLRVHEGRMPFECNDCGREFRLRDGLVKHMRIHTGERPYACGVCGKHFKRVHHRKKHLQAKHLAGDDAPCPSSSSTVPQPSDSTPALSQSLLARLAGALPFSLQPSLDPSQPAMSID